LIHSFYFNYKYCQDGIPDNAVQAKPLVANDITVIKNKNKEASVKPSVEGATNYMYFNTLDDIKASSDGTEFVVPKDVNEDTLYYYTAVGPTGVQSQKARINVIVVDEATPDEDAVCEHDFTDWKVRVAPTCTKDGEEYRKCNKCGLEETQIVEAKGHVFGDWVITKEATESQEGERTKTCTKCGEKITEALPQLNSDKLYTDGPKLDASNQEVAESENASVIKNNDAVDENNTDDDDVDDSPKTGDRAGIVVIMLACLVSLTLLLAFVVRRRIH